jgi:hypothetical protein
VVAVAGALVVLIATLVAGDRPPSGLRWFTMPGYLWLARAAVSVLRAALRGR